MNKFKLIGQCIQNAAQNWQLVHCYGQATAHSNALSDQPFAKIWTGGAFVNVPLPPGKKLIIEMMPSLDGGVITRYFLGTKVD